MAFTLVIRPVCCDTTDDLIGRNLVQEFGQHGRITYIVCGDLHGPNFECFLIDPNVNLAPDASFGATMLTGIPFITWQAIAQHSPRGRLLLRR